MLTPFRPSRGKRRARPAASAVAMARAHCVARSRGPDRTRGEGPSDDRLVVYVDADCGLCSFVAIWLRRLDILRRLRFVAIEDVPADAGMPPRSRLLETVHARDARGHWWTGAAAFLQIAQRVPPLWPFALLGHVPPVARVMERGYRRIARDRGSLSIRLGLEACRLPPDRRP